LASAEADLGLVLARKFNRPRSDDMKGYLIANIDVRDPKAFDEYRETVSPMIARFGGRYLVRGGNCAMWKETSS
jgi:hypothetical protein